jgi:putative spermidine/putrescine transport system ATP-binding protein
MSTETKDAPAKTPSKGFSLRSRLLGIPSAGTPDEAAPVDETSEAPAALEDPAADATPEASVNAPDETLPPADDADEADEPPRVGMAVAPKRSILAMAFGSGERKAKAEKSKYEEALVGNDQPKAEEPHAEAAAVEALQAVEAPQAEAAAAPVVEPEPIPEPVLPAAAVEPSRGRLFSMLRNQANASPATQDTPGVTDPEDAARAAAIIGVEEKAPEATPFVRFAGVTKTYDGINLVVRGLDLNIAKGEFLTLLGPSGSGKTTTLMMLAGFEQPTSGEILLNGSSLNDMPPHKRGLGFVFQNYALFPHMSVQENVSFPLEVRRIRGSEIKARVAKALGMVELVGFEKRKPHQLSGGQQQRVAMARALVFDPDLVLMDEPLGALDKHLREQMQYELKRLHRELGVTMVYVTHDQSEALTLSDRIAVFHEGNIQQLDTPSKIYQEPANAFVAGFIGENNALPGKIVAIKGNECEVELIGGSRVRARNGNCDTVGQTGVVCVRPENLSISAETTPGGNHVAALVEDFIFHGDHVRVKLSAPGMSEIYVKTPARTTNLPSKGVAVTLCWEPSSARAFAS